MPGFSPNNQAESDEYIGQENYDVDDDRAVNIFNERSDSPPPKPELASPEFRPHQKVYRTKPLEDFSHSGPGDFGQRISKVKTN